MIGKTLAEDFSQDNSNMDYFRKFGAEFASGFMYGIDADHIG
jgi:hypothetical protein